MPQHDAPATHSQAPDLPAASFDLLTDADRKRIWDRMLARPVPQRPVQPLSDFDRCFQELVPGRLEPYIRFSACLVALELEDFSTAHNRVMRVAGKYGASHLSNGAWDALDSWIDQQLLACIDEPVPEGLVLPEQLARITGEPRKAVP